MKVFTFYFIGTDGSLFFYEILFYTYSQKNDDNV